MSQSVIWYATECAMKKYPMRIVQGALFLPNGEEVLLTDSKLICNGWGEVGSLRLDTTEPRELPVMLKVDWYSYSEDAFFTGNFEIPSLKLHKMFSDGHIDPASGERLDYEFIVIGLALEGRVSLWIAGGGTTLEVGGFLAERIQVRFEDVFGSEVDKELYHEEAIERLQETEGLSGESIKLPIPKNLWNEYHQRFRTQVVFYGGDNSQLWLKTTDGQCQYFDAEEPRDTEISLSRIERGVLFWETLDGRCWRAEFSMNEGDVVRAYDTLQQLAPHALITIEFELGNTRPAIYIQLKSEKWLVSLKPVVHSMVLG